MSSESRSSSAVRNLRSIFENKASESTTPDSRGRSPNELGSDKENIHRPKSKVRASFVAVEPVLNMATAVDGSGVRRGSFGEADGDLDLKKTISDQQGRMEIPEGAIESVAPSAIGTPLGSPNNDTLVDDSPLAGKIDQAPANPDKPVTGAEEEPSDMKPANPADEDAVSGGEALPPVAEDLRPSEKSTSIKADTKSDPKKATINGKPAAISTKAPAKPTASTVKSPASQPRTPLSAKTSSFTDSPAQKKPPRSSLTAPTAASMARSGPAADKSAAKTSPSSKPTPREVTKPVNISSHLTAPTAASKAKQEAEATAQPSTFRASLASRPKQPTTSTKPTSRSSLAPQQRPGSRGSENAGRRSLAPADGSFLDRMTRPTAASANRNTEKTEAKSSPKPKPTTKPKINGQASKTVSKSAPKGVAAEESTPVDGDQSSEQTGLTFASGAANVDEAIDVAVGGSETPNPHSTAGADEALEATPAALGGEETIR